MFLTVTTVFLAQATIDIRQDLIFAGGDLCSNFDCDSNYPRINIGYPMIHNLNYGGGMDIDFGS